MQASMRKVVLRRSKEQEKKAGSLLVKAGVVTKMQRELNVENETFPPASVPKRRLPG
ncbi:MAG: hypothetical protein WDA20_01605 [Desulfuromonadales bacterium]